MEHRAPETMKVIIEVKYLMQRLGWTVERLREELNAFLPQSRHIPGTHSGIVQLYRWLNVTGNNWSEPLSEISLAMKKLLKAKKDQKKH